MSVHKLPDQEQEFKPPSHEPKAAPKPPKDPYPMVTLTDITLMSQDQIFNSSLEQKETHDSVDQVG
jgi:hypothetical protein